MYDYSSELQQRVALFESHLKKMLEHRCDEDADCAIVFMEENPEDA